MRHERAAQIEQIKEYQSSCDRDAAKISGREMQLIELNTELNNLKQQAEQLCQANKRPQSAQNNGNSSSPSSSPFSNPSSKRMNLIINFRLCSMWKTRERLLCGRNSKKKLFYGLARMVLEMWHSKEHKQQINLEFSSHCNNHGFATRHTQNNNTRHGFNLSI